MKHISPRELAYCGMLGAAALLLPILFHLVHLGSAFMPMVLPLCVLPFFVRPLPAATTAALVPLLSGALTGMPPFFPPVALFMSIELAVMTTIIAFIVRRWPKVNEWLALIPVLLLGRAVYAALVYGCSLVIDLPAGVVAGMSLLRGLPGLVLITVVVPPVARLRRRMARNELVRAKK